MNQRGTGFKHPVPGVLNPDEAPPGYHAVLKENSGHGGANICRVCDWRPYCDGRSYRCSSYEVRADDGTILKREDRCSVVFKLNEVKL